MDEKYSAAGTEEAVELPWLIFTLSGNAYAVNSKYVNGIEMRPDSVTPLPEAPDIYCGLMKRREEVYPLLNMRKVFHFLSVDEETTEFVKMMEQRKQDHIRWIDTLEKCAETGDKFTLATDPHKCAFGIWYDRFINENQSAGLHIKKVEEPHRLLHESATAVLDALGRGDNETASKLIKKAREDYVPKVLAVLDEAEKAFRSTFRETVVVLSDGDQMLGLLVDEVLAVDKIESVNGSASMNLLLQSKFFEGIARNDKIDLEILIVDEEELLKLSDVDGAPKKKLS